MHATRRATLLLFAAGLAAPAWTWAQAPAPALYWPVVTDHPQALEISSETSSRPLRRFNAPRPAERADNPTRRHVGVDLFANPDDAVIALEDGRIVAFYPFLRASTGEMTYALLVAHPGYVATYGEVRANSLLMHGLAVGDAVSAGQPIAAVSDTAQLHFETYLPGLTRNLSWAHGATQPAGVVDPTPRLRDLADRGRRVRPGIDFTRSHP